MQLVELSGVGSGEVYLKILVSAQFGVIRSKIGCPMGVISVKRPPPYRLKVEKSPKPRFHAIADWARQRMREAYNAVVVAYLIASERLKAGDRLAEFPEGTFPPALPFVPFSVRCRGQPA